MEYEVKFERAMLALAEIYVSIYEFDLKENSLKAIKNNSVIQALSEAVDGAQEKLNYVMESITFPEYLNEMHMFIDFSTINERLRDRNDISMVFMGKVSGWCRARFIVVDYDIAGSLHHVLFTVESINEEKIRENHLRHLAQTDLLTGLVNRGYGENCISEQIDDQKYGMFVVMDVDKFKNVNDKYGHQIGDRVLIEVSNAMKRVAGKHDIVMRLGEDEFAAYFPDITDEQEGIGVIEKLFQEIEKIKIVPMKRHVSVSLGVRFAEEEDNFDTLYQKADQGVLFSKETKGNAYTVVDSQQESLLNE